MNKYDYNKICSIKEMCEMTNTKYDKHHSARSLVEMERGYEIEQVSDRRYRLVKELEITDKELYKSVNKKYYTQCNYDNFTVDWKNREGSGVYKIQLGNTIYIGQTNNFKNRYNTHRRGQTNKSIKDILDLGATFDLVCYESDLEARLLKEASYAKYYQKIGLNVINDFTKTVKDNYSKSNKEKFITLKIKLNELDSVVALLKDNNMFVERMTKKK